MHSLGGIRVPPLTAPLRPLQPFLSLSMNSRRNSNCLEPIFFSSLISRGRGRENISLPPQKVSFHKPWSVLGTACLELELRVAFQAFQVCGGLWVKAGWSPALGRLPSSHTCPDIPHHCRLPSARPWPGPSLPSRWISTLVWLHVSCPLSRKEKQDRALVLLQPDYVPASPIHVSSWHLFPEGSEGLWEPL